MAKIGNYTHAKLKQIIKQVADESDVSMSSNTSTNNAVIVANGTGAKSIKQVNATATFGNQSVTGINNLTASGDAVISGDLTVSGSKIDLGNAHTDVVYVAAQLTAANGIQIGSGTTIYVAAGVVTTAMTASALRVQGEAYFHHHITASSGITVQSGNRIGIGVTNPTYGVELQNIMTDNNDSGKIKATAFVTYSSVKYKTDVNTIKGATNMLDSIRGVTYTSNYGNDKQYGFIAEEVGSVMPEIVEFESNTPDAAAMDYTRIIPVLVEAVKEKNKKINNQQKQLNNQQKQIDTLKNQLNDILATLK